MAKQIQCVGMRVDAYILNTSVVGDTYFLAPSEKPAYERLLPGCSYLRHDVIPSVGLETSSPWQQNSRIADVESGNVINSRLGIYLHWCVPKIFRSGEAAGKPQQSTTGSPTDGQTSGAVEYESVPDRWLVFRYVGQCEPSTVSPPALETFLVESNMIRKVDDVVAGGEDLETAASPFLDPDHPAEDQLRTVLGRVSSLADDWNPGVGGLDDEAAAAQEGYHCPFTIIKSGNPLFADYMPHNAAVFSLHDDLTWGGQAPGTIQSATVSYAVYGFSSKDARDLLPKPPATQVSTDEASTTGITGATTQATPAITPTGTTTVSPATTVATATTPVQSAPVRVCWGTIYSVEYQNSASPNPTKATGMAQDFKAKTPLAVGEDVMDACIAMLGGSQDPQESSMADVLRGLTAAAALQESNAQLGRAPIATTNFKSAHGGYRWRLAHDQSKSTESTQPLAPTGQTSVMKPGQIAALRQLNQVQTYLDALFRRKRYIRHLIFCEWWKCRSQQGSDDQLSQQRRAKTVATAKVLLNRMDMVNSLVVGAEALLAKMQKSEAAYGPFAKDTRKKFYSHTDPAFVVRDMGSGWPEGWDNDATIVNDQDVEVWVSNNASSLATWLNQTPFSTANAPTTEARIPDVWDQFFSTKGLTNLPAEMQASLKNVMIAFSQDLITSKPPASPLITNPSWNSWDGQPWLPVFVEWEVEYAHIPIDMWELTHSDNGTISYGIRGGKTLASPNLSSRTFSGRSILLPNAQKAIIGLMKLVYGTIPGTGDQQNQDQAWMEQFLSNLSFLFGRLDGFTDHLLTLYQGTHAVPPKSQIAIGTADDPLIKSRVARYQAGEEILTDKDALSLFYGNLPSTVKDATEATGGLDVTPYGIDHEGLSYTASQSISPPADKDLFFRPVTHGQARLVQFKLVDRFGQVICATDPRMGQPVTPFYPYIGDGLVCDSTSGSKTGTTQANTAIPLTPEEITGGDCAWFQIGPRINQDVRLHADFLCHRDLTGGKQSNKGQYRPVAEGEQGAFAWLLINYNNQSLQLYEGDCSFRGEALLPAGPHKPVYWQSLLGKGHGPDILPYMLPQQHESLLKEQLQQLAKVNSSQASPSEPGGLPMSLEDLIVSMSYAPFLIELWKVVIAAQESIEPPPAKQYAQFPPALVGRPLALARLGLGMELATAPMHSQAYADYAESDPTQVQPQTASTSTDTAKTAGAATPATTATPATAATPAATATPATTATKLETDDPSEGTGDEMLTCYSFAVKIGDMLGREDGLVAYFSSPKSSKANGGAWIINTDYTPAGDLSPSSLVQHTTKAPPLGISPRYPRLLPLATTAKDVNIQDEVADYELRAADSLYSSTTTVLIDPFHPVHVRSAVLPVTTAKLDRAVVDQDLQRLGVWLQAGPILIGARGADPITDTQGTATIQPVTGSGKSSPGPRVPAFTAGSAGGGLEWKWVQPVGGKDGSVNYLHLGIMPPLKEGFDCLAGTGSQAAPAPVVKLATALDGYLLLKDEQSIS